MKFDNFNFTNVLENSIRENTKKIEELQNKHNSAIEQKNKEINDRENNKLKELIIQNETIKNLLNLTIENSRKDEKKYNITNRKNSIILLVTSLGVIISIISLIVSILK